MLEMRFPSRGDVYEALEDYLTHWRAPFTGGGRGTLRKGDRVTVDHEPVDSMALSVYAAPVDQSVEARMVPASDRSDPKYDGYSLVLRTADLNRRFRLIPEDEA